MMKLFIILTSLLKKGVALMLLSALTIFSRAFNVIYFVYRMIADVFALIGTFLIAADWISSGFTAEIGYSILSLVCIVALRFLLPLLVPVMQRWEENLSDYIHEPMHYASPVRYTI